MRSSSNNYYKRGNGVNVLKKRLSIFSYLFILLPVVTIFVTYVYKNQEIKSISRKIDELETKKMQLVEQYERLISDYEKMNSYIEVKQFAEERLSMKHSVNNLGYFIVYDERSVFKNYKTSNLPKLFEHSVDLAMISTDPYYKNPE